jgi:8-hydroxy-5-deazaflavin:NADPH oxidoreductase
VTSNITILGAGRVGTALAIALTQAGRSVFVGVRQPARASEVWTGPPVTFSDIPDAIAQSDFVINATPGDTTLERLSALETELAGKILVDLANATVRTTDGLPGGLLYPDSSLGERLQKALPKTYVVKTLNTMLFSAMTTPGALGVAPSVFVSGDHPEAKFRVRKLLAELGWDDEWILDIGGIDTAQGTEAFALLVPSLLQTLGFAPFALAIAR